MRRAIIHLRQADPVLGEIIERVGPCKLQYAEPDFETMVRSIIFQQLNGKAARAIFARFKEAVGGGSRMAPHEVLALPPEKMRALGLSQRKVEYVRDLAEKTRAGVIEFSRLARLPDEDVIEHLTAVKGVGVWTAHMFLLFALRRPDILATGDFGIRSAIRKAYRLRKLPTRARVEKLGARWHPHCSVACWYLWRSFDTVVGV
ncbi:MAG TPA: DNA-3-methyladenine glycosylase [Candidatus Methylomirabilis sp.]|nr:DNA-3-methyladenine glycosylase [Candidatus Methylomirabilis sp.]